ncbi:MAG: hypothetical protein Q9227_008397 [Pyrenula ochraceoflavens]
MNNDNPDPYDWSVEKVIAELCHNPQFPGSTGRSLQRPNPTVFEAKLRENDINGEVLLDHVDKDVIKNHLGVSSFGQIIAVEWAITHLRNESAQWSKKRTAAVDSRQPDYGPVTPYSTVPRRSVPVGHAYGSPSRAFPYPPFDYSSARPPTLSDGQSLRQSTVQTNIGSVDKAAAQHDELPFKESESVLTDDLHGFSDSNNERRSSVTPSRLLTKGNFVEGVITKRSANTPLLGQEDDVRSPGAQSECQNVKTEKPRRITPMLVATADESLLGSANQFYGHNRVAIGNVFYRTTTDDDSREFTFQADGGARGSQQWIGALMKQYFQQPLQSIAGSKALALVPYSSSRLKGLPASRRHQQFTMYESYGQMKISDATDWPGLELRRVQNHPAQPAFSKERITPALHYSLESQSQDGDALEDDEYQDLLRRYPVQSEDEEEIAVDYANSVGSFDDDTWAEIQEERQEQLAAANEREMSSKEVETIIVEVISHLIHEWRESKSTPWARKVFRLWRKANEFVDGRSTERKSAEKRLAQLERSLSKAQQEIASHQWHKPEDVRQQCQSLESFVFQREEQKSLLEALRSDECPPPPPRLVHRKRKLPIALPEGEEVLTDEQTSSSEDDLANFIEEDLAISVPIKPRANTPLVYSDDDFKNEGSPRAANIEVSLPLDHPLSEITMKEPRDISMTLGGDEVEPRIMKDGHSLGSQKVSEPLPEQEPAYEKATILDLGSDSGEEDSSSAERPSSSQPMISVVIPISQNSRAEAPLIEHAAKPEAPAKSKYKSSGHTREEAIALSSDTDVQPRESAMRNRTPLTKMKKGGTPRSRNLRIIDSSSPERSPPRTSLPTTSSSISPISPGRFALKNLEDKEAIRNLSWEDLEANHDHKRALAKIVYSMPPPQVRRVYHLVAKRDHSFVQAIIPAGLEALRGGKEEVPNIAPEQQRAASLLCSLYASYVNCKDLVNPKILDHHGPLEDLMSTAMAPDDYHKFVGDLLWVLQCHLGGSMVLGKGETLESESKKRKAEEEPLTDIDHIADKGTAHHTPHKKRVKKVQQSQEALDLQKSDRKRVQEFEAKRQQFQASFQGAESGEEVHAIGLGEPEILIHSHIGQKIKHHQVLGAQFLWREIIADPKRQGCLLAHTMGLGKTMQVITLLVTIALAKENSDSAIRNQVQHFSSCRFLILCPPSLVDNWADEFAMWVPEEARAVRGCWKISSAMKPIERADAIDRWFEERGPLIISYEMLRVLASNPKQHFSPDEHKRLRTALLDGPSIVVADEAHKMKNATSKISQITKLFKTRSRVALTGSPLANNLEEYYEMIEWIAPGYLGSSVQFKAKYAEPIKEGLYADSSDYEQRRGLKRLEVLKKDLDPKVCRADITAIAGDLPVKTEFYITVSLTATQRKVYEKFIVAVLGDDPDAAGNARLWDWLTILSLLCNHPRCFSSKLEERAYAGSHTGSHAAKKKRAASEKKAETTDDPEGDALPDDVDTLAQIGLSQDILDDLIKMFTKLEDNGKDLDHPVHSNRALVVDKLIDRCINQGDKVLLFSHSIPTLDYLQDMLELSGRRWTRLDGSTAVSKRQHATKVFNSAQSEYDIFLISTRAGGLGLNLPGANRVIIYDFGFNPQWEEQAIGRAYRLGQTKPVFVYRFRAGGTFEEVMYNKAVFKTQLSARVVDKKNPMRWASKSARDYLFKPRTVQPTDITEFHDKDKDVLGHVLNNKHILKIELTETFQREHKEELSAEEEREIREELEDERLKRTDYQAWLQKNSQRQLAAKHISNGQLNTEPVKSHGIVNTIASGARGFSNERLSEMQALIPPYAKHMTKDILSSVQRLIRREDSPPLATYGDFRKFMDGLPAQRSVEEPAPQSIVRNEDRNRAASTCPNHETLGESSYR